MLVLFDIDGTLLTGDGIGMRALTDAAQSLFGKDFTSNGISYAGRLDPLIIQELFELNGVQATSHNIGSLREAYVRGLVEDICDLSITPLPGAAELVTHLSGVAGVTVGVLTGNFPESGTHKLTAAGFDLSLFEVCVWGDDSPHSPPHRDHLPGVAMRRYAELHAREIDPASIIVIGDTPGDVRCAHHVGARCLGVTTGRFGARNLGEAGADLVVDSLENTAELARWILDPAPARSVTGR